MNAALDARRPARPALAVLALATALLAAATARPTTPRQDAADALSEGGDVGVIVDREGVAARRPVLADRWGPADARRPLEPGDWLKTGARGANALAAELASGAGLLLGPDTLVEVVGGASVRLVRGELRVTADERAPLAVAGPGESQLTVRGRAVLRARDGNLVRLDEDPRWLTGYEGNASTEALGSLLANVDGRNVPLTLGYHKVTVDVRDQIARTVIEESFINHTPTVLEGVFYFPLPADASISGFGMWIGDELVQGDIVEKQRAREIYETILRERRDPGLLEWSGGNIFKARVFPIGAEKRIRIAYTQVLPKEGDTWSYHYSLQSELLRKNPLRQLQVEVNVHSAEALQDVTCPSHECRVRVTEHSAKVEFEAEEYSPDRDFELRVRTRAAGFAATAVPHRRGDDGYFMLLLDTPVEAGGPAAPSEPLELLVLADTSGSLFGAPREAQVGFLEALLGALDERDRFDLATCDTRVRWAFGGLRGGGDAARQALDFLEARAPLGWSDLDAAFAAAVERAGPHTHVVYVGDGQPTAGDADPIAVAQRLRRAWRGQGTFHAVVPGNRSEPAVLRALAGLGGGSVRAIGGGTDPASAAFDLLAEVAAPAVKDLELAFEGVSVAAVYPERLPNLPLGRQQVVVGRFDPTLGDEAGRVAVTGTLNGEPVRFEAELALAADDTGNSFVPRLWARRHLDQLLDQGRSDGVQERIIALSEDFQIVTPYTSFLVLESDADRERFQVQRQFRMRDGEEFFAEGREDARHELRRQQMLAAKGWRTRLRAQVLATLAGMNRELTELLRGQPAPRDGALALGLAGNEWGAATRELERGGADDFFLGRDELRLGDYRGPGDTVPPGDWGEGEADERFAEDAGEAFQDALPAEEPMMEEQAAYDRPAGAPARSVAAKSVVGFRRQRLDAGRASIAQEAWGGGGRYAPSYDPFAGLFPAVGPPRTEDPEPSWPDEVRELLARLDRRRAVAASVDGWRIRLGTEYTDLRGRVQRSAGQWWLGADRWAVESPHLAGHAWSLSWQADGERGALTTGWNLARRRDATDGDALAWPAPFAWHFGDQLRYYVGFSASLEEGEDGRVSVVLVQPQQPETRTVLVIDPGRGTLVEQRTEVKGDVTARLTFGEPREVGGVWWPTEVRTWHPDRTDGTVTRVEVEALEAPALARALETVLAVRGDAIVLPEVLPEVVAAKQTVQEGEAGLAERFALLSYYAATQRWADADPHLAAIEALEAGKPGLVPLRLTRLQQGRGQAELAVLVMEWARALAAEPRDAEYGMATMLLGFAGDLNPGNELAAFLEAIEPVFARQVGILDAKLPWDQRRLSTLQNLGRPEEAFLHLRAMAAAYPYQVQVQNQYASSLAQRGAVDQALAHLAGVEADAGPWQPWERSQLRSTVASVLWNAYRLEDLAAQVEAWDQADPTLVDANLYGQLLSALVFLDREERAWGYVERWLTDYRRVELEPFEQARLQAAVQFGLGNGYGLYRRRFDDEHAALLADTARALAALDDSPLVYLAGQILQAWQFRDTDAARAVRAALFEQLEAGVQELPTKRVSNLVGWLRGAGFQPPEGEPGWQALLDRVFERWLATPDGEERTLLGQTVLGHGRRELALRLHRHVYATAEEPAQRAAAAATLFHFLMAGAWSPEVEAELVALLPVVVEPGGEDEVAEQRLVQRILALYDLAGWLPEARTQALVAALPEVNSMPRRLLAAKRDELLREARTAAAELLGRLAAELQPEALRPWAAVERAYLLVRAREDLRAARTSSMETLTALRAQHLGAEVEADVPLRDRVLAARCAATVAYLLARYDEETRAEHEGPYLALLDEGLAQDTVLLDWRELKYALLVALDRGDALQAALAEWYGGGEELARMRWGRDYAHVLAERGELEAAATTLEEVEGLDELSHEDYRALEGWYTALDRQDAAREARVRSWTVLGERALGQALSNEASRYQRRGDQVPPDLDPEVPVRFVALMRKAAYPANWSWVLQRYYDPTQDFRLLECVPEAVLGHSPQAIYPFLQNLGGLADAVHEEATLDRLRAHLAELRETRAETDVDRRALSLLEFMFVQRATRQAHGTEEHARIAMAALRSASRGEWQEGERVMMAAFLAAQGAVRPELLKVEQLRAMRDLMRDLEHVTDRFAIAGYLANTLWAHGERENAVRTLEGALQRLRAAGDGRLPRDADDELGTLSGWWAAMGSYAQAEELWLEELEGDLERDRELGYRLRLFELYEQALLAKATVSLGSGEALYRAVVARLIAATTERTNEGHARQLVNRLCSVWNRVHRELHYEGPRRDATRFAFSELPAVLDLYQYRGGQGMVSDVADCLETVRDPQTAVEFLTVRAENEPTWLRWADQDFWNQHGWRYARYRARAGKLPPALEERVLTITLAELREDLRTRRQRQRAMYDVRYGDFWTEQRGAFLREALAFLNEHGQNGAAVVHATEYLFRGLNAYDEAIAALARAHRGGFLEVDGRTQLAVFLQERQRWAESIPVLDELVADRPDDVHHRVMLMRGHFHVDDARRLERTFALAEAYYREQEAWREGVIAPLAAACLETRLLTDCVRLYDEAVALHVKTARNRGVGDGVLSQYYRNLSAAHSGLGNVAAAVDAAAGAIVSWGRSQHQRQQDLEMLQQVLFDAEDLDGYVEQLDAECRATGLENPIVRKALGQAYSQREDFARAAAQLRLALLAQPNDLETHAQLVAACDSARRPDQAAAALLDWARIAEHDLSLYRQLGDRYATREDEDAAERAWTTAVEAQPNESESHALLADLRQEQGRWSDAATHWRHVIRVRTKEPAGYLGLARALIRLERWDDAQEVIDTLISTEWPERFGDVAEQGRRLMREIPRSR